MDVAEVKVEKKESTHKQITMQLRRQIALGEYPPGSRLPSIEEMSKMWNVSAFTVHSALTPLAKSGILVRKRRLGTFIAERPKRITCAAIYYSGEIWGVAGMEFYRAMHQQLCRELSADNIAVRVWIDSREASQQYTVFQPLRDAIDSGEVQCLIAPRVSSYEIQELNKLPIVSVFITDQKADNRVSYGSSDFMRLSMESLKRRGCKAVGIVSAISFQDDSREGAGMYSLAFDQARELGMELRPEWICAPKLHQEADTYERHGYDSFKSLWSQSSRPDGLIVYPDVAVRGVVLALCELHVRVPEELQLVLHRNESVDILCPFQTAWCVSSVTSMARAMIQQVKNQFEGGTAEASQIPFTVVEPE